MSKGRTLSPAILQEIQRDVVYPITFVRLAYDDGDVLVHDNIGEIHWNDETWSGVGSLGGIEHIEETTEITNLSLRLVLSGLNSRIVQEALNEDYYRREVTIYYGVLNPATGVLKGVNPTTTEEALNNTERQIHVTDTSDIVVGSVVRIRSEEMLVSAVRSSDHRLTVTRQYNSTPAVTAPNGASVEVVPEPDIIWSGFMDIMEASISGDEFGIILTAENEDVDFERPNGKLYSNAQQQTDFPGDRAFEYLENQEEIVLRFPDSPVPSLGRTRSSFPGFPPGFPSF